MIDVANFATEEFALRCSELPKLMQCTLQSVFKVFKVFEDHSGPAADTGSAVHKAAEAYHTTAAKDVKVAIQAMRNGLEKYPFADLESAAEQFLCYARDYRNERADIVLIEQKMQLEIPSHPTDKTKRPVVIHGTCDQIRRVNGRLELHDLKTSSKDGWDIHTNASYQLAAYQVAATQHLKERVHRAFIIRTKDYLKKTTGPVFYECPWGLQDAYDMLKCVSLRVAQVRAGLIDYSPGEHCRWCEAGGMPNCNAKLQTLGVLRHV